MISTRTFHVFFPEVFDLSYVLEVSFCVFSPCFLSFFLFGYQLPETPQAAVPHQLPAAVWGPPARPSSSGRLKVWL